MCHILDVSPPRAVSLLESLPPFVLYTDASDVPERSPRFVVGAVLIFPPPTRRVEFFTYVVPQILVDQWLPKQTYMGQLEVLAAPLSLATWSSTLSRSRVIHFVDNDAAASSLVRGYSPKVDSSLLVSNYWSLAAESAIDPYIDRVESKSNLSDGPSRLDETLMIQLRARKVAPNFDFLFDFSRWDTAATAPAVPLEVHNTTYTEREGQTNVGRTPPLDLLVLSDTPESRYSLLLTVLSSGSRVSQGGKRVSHRKEKKEGSL